MNESSLYKNDFSPPLKDCACPCCQRHTRAYVCHLLATGELLGSVLLAAHNLHHWFAFFDHLRRSIREGGGGLQQMRERLREAASANGEEDH